MAKYFHLAGAPLGVGSIIRPGNYIRIVARYGRRHTSWDREAALESWRANNEPSLPSRAASVFAFINENAAHAFRSGEPGFTMHLLYEVSPVDLSVPIHIARIEDFRPRSPYDRDWPARYWRTGQASASEAAIGTDPAMAVGTEAREVLIGGPVRVEACLDDL